MQNGVIQVALTGNATLFLVKPVVLVPYYALHLCFATIFSYVCTICRWKLRGTASFSRRCSPSWSRATRWKRASRSQTSSKRLSGERPVCVRVVILHYLNSPSHSSGLGLHDVSPAQTLVLEDATLGIEAGIAAGMRTIHVSSMLA